MLITKVVASSFWTTNKFPEQCFYMFLQDEDDEDEDNEEEGGLSKSGKELKKLLGRTGGLNDSDVEDDDDDDDVSLV
jgi:hypothetical protein